MHTVEVGANGSSGATGELKRLLSGRDPLFWTRLAERVPAVRAVDRAAETVEVQRLAKNGVRTFDARTTSVSLSGNVDVAGSPYADRTVPVIVAAYAGGRVPPPSRMNDGFMRPDFPQQVLYSYYAASLVAERNARRSRSRFTSRRTATDCTRPADRPRRTFFQSSGEI